VGRPITKGTEHHPRHMVGLQRRLPLPRLRHRQTGTERQTQQKGSRMSTPLTGRWALRQYTWLLGAPARKADPWWIERDTVTADPEDPALVVDAAGVGHIANMPAGFPTGTLYAMVPTTLGQPYEHHRAKLCRKEQARAENYYYHDYLAKLTVARDGAATITEGGRA
jgi:hypothetical protein